MNPLKRNTTPENPTVILGALGQDGQLLANHLLNCQKKVVSVVRPGRDLSTALVQRNPYKQNHEFIELDLFNVDEVKKTIRALRPESIFHLATIHATKSVMDSKDWEQKSFQTEIIHIELTQAIIATVVKSTPNTKVVLAGSSRMYSTEGSSDLIIDELSPMCPRDFYGETKKAAHDLLMDSRARNSVDFKTAILFNHESEYRKEGFLFKDLAVEINRSLTTGSPIRVWNSQARGDWHSARDTVKGLHLLSNCGPMSSMVFSSGKSKSVRDIINEFFSLYYPDLTPFIESPESNPLPAVVGDNSLARLSGWIADDSITSVMKRMLEEVRNSQNA